jgi:hypothetical protein
VKSFERNGRRRVFELRKEGFETTRRELTLDRDVHLAVAMTSLVPEPRLETEAAAEALDASSEPPERSLDDGSHRGQAPRRDEDERRHDARRNESSRSQDRAPSEPAAGVSSPVDRRGVIDPFAEQ